jgi:hypothetical protein
MNGRIYEEPADFSDILLLPRLGQAKAKVIDKQRPRIFPFNFEGFRPQTVSSVKRPLNELHASEVDDHVRRAGDGVVLVGRNAKVRIAAERKRIP